MMQEVFSTSRRNTGKFRIGLVPPLVVIVAGRTGRACIAGRCGAETCIIGISAGKRPSLQSLSATRLSIALETKALQQLQFGRGSSSTRDLSAQA